MTWPLKHAIRARGSCCVPCPPRTSAAFNRKLAAWGGLVCRFSHGIAAYLEERRRPGSTYQSRWSGVGCERPADPRRRVPCLRPNNKKFLTSAIAVTISLLPPTLPIVALGSETGIFGRISEAANRDSLLDTVTRYQKLGHHPTSRIAFRDLSTRLIFVLSASSASRRLSHTPWIIISTRRSLRCPALSLSRISLSTSDVSEAVQHFRCLADEAGEQSKHRGRQLFFSSS
jgi:hypothetical protein